MRLRLDMCDVDFQLKIKGWEKHDPKHDYCSHWTEDEFSLKGKYIDYSFDSEVMLSDEVEYLRDVLGALLDGKLKEDGHVRFAEPDFEFCLSVAKRLYDQPGKVVYRNGYMDIDISMEMIIHFWYDDGGLGSNTFTMTFNRNEIRAFYAYLQLVTAKIDTNDAQAQQYLASGVLISD